MDIRQEFPIKVGLHKVHIHEDKFVVEGYEFSHLQDAVNYAYDLSIHKSISSEPVPEGFQILRKGRKYMVVDPTGNTRHFSTESKAREHIRVASSCR